jgi:choline-glycine betaine transporter
LQSGALDTVLSITVLSSVPMIPIMILLCLSLVRWLNRDFGHLVKHKELTLPTNNITDGG